MNKIVLLMFAFIFLFGCIGPNNNNNQNENTNQPSSSNGTMNVNDDLGVDIIDISTSHYEDNPYNPDQEDTVNYQTTNRNRFSPRINDRYALVKVPGSDVNIYFFDLYDGEAALIKKGDLDVLIDTGRKETAEQLVSRLKVLDVDDIDVLISTHKADKVIGGIPTLSRNFIIEELWYNGFDDNNSEFNQDVYMLKNKRTSIKIAKQGDRTSINGVEFTILSPGNDSRLISDAQRSLVIKIKVNNKCLIFTGDADADIQRTILLANKDYGFLNEKCDVFVVPKQGTGASGYQLISYEFLKKIDPKVAIIYAPAITRRTMTSEAKLILQQNNIKVYSTDTSGEIVLSLFSQGQDFEVSTEKAS